MRTLSSQTASHLIEEVTNLTACWIVIKKDGVVIRGTQHDNDIQIDTGAFAGLYLSAAGITASDLHSGSDMSPDNAEVQGVVPEDAFLIDIKPADIEAGLFDDVDCKLFLCNWDAPNDGQIQMPGATLGNIQRTAEGRYVAELRGLNQRLAQPILRTYSPTCNAELGDTRCGVDVAPYINLVTVTSVTSRRLFNCSLTFDTSTLIGGYTLGKLVGVTGGNAGYTREIKRDAIGSVLGNLELWEPMPVDVQVGDTFNMHPGCNKEKDTDCKLRYDNVLRFRGFGVFTPTINKMLRGPDRGSGPV